VRPRRAAARRANGLEIVSPHGNVTLAPKIIEAHKIDAPYEAVLLTVKAFSLEASMGDFASAVGEDGRAGCVHAWWRLSNARLQGARNSRSDFSMRC
jgi:ketopantoate reductase